MSELDDWLESREEARRLWASGATVKEVARAAGVSVGRAGQLVAKFQREEKAKARRAAKERMQSALLCLHDNGFSKDEIAIFFDLSAAEVNRMKNAADVASGRAKPPFDAELELSVRAVNTLKKLNAVTTDDVCNISERELRKTQGCGKGTLEEIKSELKRIGRSLSP